ncbi:MAG: hypothetical protein HOD72_06185 [Opitutae bacterium]|jgi:hypothetical protein|nr:hypothetical protein [Opitutae bacterium]MBT4224038.1 hypothetical protein [Opitutae bacterium]MBT5378444.1 hypothetical protein [Opitutae bacterium]MBT5690906.1 hypothetical protein [Opitutae bacterium]MBT6461007.1 hypothetical protein [Opitutae bacterium]
MIGIISISSEDPLHSGGENSPIHLLPDNLQDSGSWKFIAKPSATESPKLLVESHNQVRDRVAIICQHLREGLAFLKAQEKGLHEAISAIDSIGQLISRRDQGHYPRVQESQLQEEFEILRIQLDGIRCRQHFNKSLYGNGATPSLRVHTSLWDIPRHEEVSVANMEALSLRLIYWGKVSGDGSPTPIHRETVHEALRHLMEITLHSQSQQERLLSVLESLMSQTSLSTTSIQPSFPKEESVLDGPLNLQSNHPGAKEPNILIRLRENLYAWVQQILPGGNSTKCIDENFHHNQDAIT